VADLEFTGERLVPEKSPKALEAEHRARYDFAKQFVKGKRVLDLGCGEGYGSRMLSEVAKSVVGVDISAEAVEHAKAAYGSDGLAFQAGDAGKLPFSEGEFDAVVCFEVIEHIRNPELLLKEVARVLSGKGIFVASTPNGGVKVSSQPNRYHVKEYTLREFEGMLADHFPPQEWETSIYGQFVRGRKYNSMKVRIKNLYLSIKGMVCMPVKEGGAGKAEEFEFSEEKAELAEYLVAVVRGA
jgi:2-polyprenyl-3-methyl-5-hydroxy-6-metoxy-1,4-benzoquinol methylase